MARQNRYSLVFRNKSGEKKYVTLNFKNSKRNTFSLTEIDYITSLFSDATFQKQSTQPQVSPTKRPKSVASVLIPAADDDYSDD